MDDLKDLLHVRPPRYTKRLEEREKLALKSHWHYEPGAPGVGHNKTQSDKGKLWMMENSNIKNVLLYGNPTEARIREQYIKQLDRQQKWSAQNFDSQKKTFIIRQLMQQESLRSIYKESPCFVPEGILRQHRRAIKDHMEKMRHTGGLPDQHNNKYAIHKQVEEKLLRDEEHDREVREGKVDDRRINSRSQSASAHPRETRSNEINNSADCLPKTTRASQLAPPRKAQRNGGLVRKSKPDIPTQEQATTTQMIRRRTALPIHNNEEPKSAMTITRNTSKPLLSSRKEKEANAAAIKTKDVSEAQPSDNKERGASNKTKKAHPRLSKTPTLARTQESALSKTLLSLKTFNRLSETATMSNTEASGLSTPQIPTTPKRPSKSAPSPRREVGTIKSPEPSTSQQRPLTTPFASTSDDNELLTIPIPPTHTCTSKSSRRPPTSQMRPTSRAEPTSIAQVYGLTQTSRPKTATRKQASTSQTAEYSARRAESRTPIKPQSSTKKRPVSSKYWSSTYQKEEEVIPDEIEVTTQSRAVHDDRFLALIESLIPQYNAVKGRNYKP